MFTTSTTKALGVPRLFTQQFINLAFVVFLHYTEFPSLVEIIFASKSIFRIKNILPTQKSKLEKCSIELLSFKHLYCLFLSHYSLTSRTADPTAEATGFPPYVLKWRAVPMPLAISGVVTTAARGYPLPMPFAMTTVQKNMLLENVCYHCHLPWTQCRNGQVVVYIRISKQMKNEQMIHSIYNQMFMKGYFSK